MQYYVLLMIIICLTFPTTVYFMRDSHGFSRVRHRTQHGPAPRKKNEIMHQKRLAVIKSILKEFKPL
jgi:hypothetical protein